MKGLNIYYKVLAAASVVFLVFFPFVTRLYAAKPVGMELEYFAKKSKVTVDLFYYHKEVLLFLFAVALLAALAAGAVFSLVIQEKFPVKLLPGEKAVVLAGGYFLLNVISCLVSNYREYALMGLSLDYEGLAAIFGYLVLFLGGSVLFLTRKSRQFLEAGIQVLSALLLAGTLAEGIWGPFFNIPWVQELLTPDRYEHLLENIYLDYHGSISLTFGNPGFYGGFCAMLAPVELGFALSAKGLGRRLWNGVLFGGLVLCVVLSGSSGAFYALCAAILLELVFVGKKFAGKRIAGAAGMALAGAALFAALLFWSAGEENISLLGKVKKSVVNTQYEKAENVFTVKKIQLEDGKLCVEGEDAALTAQVSEEMQEEGSSLTWKDVVLLDQEGKSISSTKDLQGLHLEGSFQGITVTAQGRILSFDFGYQDPVEFYAEEGRLYYIDFNGSLLAEIPQPQITGLERLYPLFTGRGYIWISALPLVKEVIFLGKGIGTFPFYYPQNEAAGMLNVHGSADYCVEQAHSWYLQTAVSSGLLSLLCMAGLFLLGFFKEIRRTAKTEGAALEGTDFMVWGLIAYAAAGLVNNSCIACAPLFWLLLGVCLRKRL